MRALVGLSAVTLLVLLTGCGARQPAAAATSSSSTTSLAAALPNLADLDVVSCAYTTTHSRPSARGVPAPSDTMVELGGHVVLSEAAARRLRDEGDWQSIERTRVPEALRGLLPDGQPMVSLPLNETFSENASFPHGYVVAMENDIHRLYFLARDGDHPIE